VSDTEDRQEELTAPVQLPSDADMRAISSELLSALMSLMPDAAVVADSTGNIVSVNTLAETLFGYTPGSLAGHSIEELVPERARLRHRRHRTGFITAPKNRPMGAGLELTGRRRDGSEFPLDISLAPIEHSGERLIVAGVRDVTEQRAAAAAQAELATIVRSSLDAIISTTLDGRITNWNPAAEELLGYGRDEIVGEHIAKLVPSHSSIVLEELLDSAASGPHRGARDTRWLHRDGSEVDVAVSISPLRDQGGTLRGFSSIARDIRERKAAETELRRLLAEEQRLEQQHAATAEIRLALLAGAPLHDSLMLMCERASELVDSPVAVICMRDPGGIRITAAVGLEPEMIGTVLPAATSFAERVIDSGQLIEIARSSEVSSVGASDSVPDGPTLGAPVIAGGVTRAALIFVRVAGANAFSQSDQFFAEVLAAQAALAFEFERARSDREAVMLAGDRDRIGRDLHDQVIQRIFAAGMGLQSALGLIDRPRAREKVSEAIDALDETVREIRNTIFSLSRSDDDDHLLSSQVIDVAKQADTALGFDSTVGFEGPIDVGVPEHIVPHVLAVVREALSNVARHAGATAVRVRIVLTGDDLLVAVIDNGVGIKAPTRSSGLANLEERARLFGGIFTVSPTRDGGTRLEWRVSIGA
jgi:PAS domain S-box-containing protein